LILGNDSGSTRCRAAVNSELWRDGGEKLILGNDSGATRCRDAVYSELWRDGGEELIPRPECLPHPRVHQLSPAHQGEQVTD
jgi:hypothetical protein